MLALQAAGVLMDLPPWLRAATALAVLAWIPGAVITSTLVPRAVLPRILRIVVSMLSGLAAQSVLAAVFAAVGASLDAYAHAAQWAAGAVMAFGWWREARREEDEQSAGRAVRKLWMGAVAALLILGAFMQSSPGLERDAFDHVGYIRHMVEVNAAAGGDILAMPIDDPTPPPPDPRKGAFHVFLAAVARSTAVDPWDVWSTATVLIFPFSFLAFLCFSRVFVSGRLQLAACGALFLFAYGGVGLYFPRSTLYGQNFSTMWFWGIAALCLVRGRGRSRASILLIVLVAMGGSLAHAGVVLHAAFLSAALVMFAPVFGHTLRSALRVGIVLAVAVVPAIVLRVLHAVDPNILHTHPQGLLYLTPRWFVFSPAEAVRQQGLLFAGGIAALFPAALFLRDNPYVRRIWAMCVLPLAVSFVPFIATPLFERASYMAFRSLLEIPAFAAIVVTTTAVSTWAWRGGVPRRALVATGLVAWSFLFLTPSIRSIGSELRAGSAGTSFGERNADVIEYLRTLPALSVVVSDPHTSYALSAFVPHLFVATNGQHGNPNDRYAMPRLAAVRDILNPWSPAGAVADQCDRWGVDVVVVNSRTPAHAHDFLSLWDQSFYGDTVLKLGSFGQRFRTLYERDDMTVFLHDPAGPRDAGWGPDDVLANAPRAGGKPCRVESPDGDYAVTGIFLDRDTVPTGGVVRIEIAYDKPRSSDFGFSHEMHVRFDHVTLPDVRGVPGEKHARRWQDRRAGKTRRFRYDRVAFDGFLPRDYWPIGREFYDRFSVPVPRWAMAGDYRIEVSISRRSLLPNFTLDDFLYNRDHYSGVACGSLTVTDGTVR